MDNENKAVNLCIYRMNNANETLDTAKLCMEHKRYKDAINRCYYAVFYAVKAVLALEEIDFKRHKDAVAYFNQNFYVASYDEAREQYEAAELIVKNIRGFLKNKNI